jgi:hypothetical protein
MVGRRQRSTLIVSALLLAGVIVGVPGIRTRILQTGGWALVGNDALEPADIIVVTADADGAGVLEAADLVHSGIAPRVAVFEDPPDAVDQEFLRRGVPYSDAAARSVQQLRSLGVAAVEQISRPVTGTNDEGRVLPEWCAQRHFLTVVVVCTSDHSRRVRRLLHRAMNGRGTRVAVRYSRYSPFDPNRWWHTRDGIRTEIVELQKLLLDLVRHPIS